MKRALAIAIVSAPLWACGGAPERPHRPTVRVAAAADLNTALGEVITRFSAAKAVDVSASYGSSGTFFAQLMNGAPFDVFLSADLEYPRRLAERGLTVKDSEFSYAVGRLVLWTPATATIDVQAMGLKAVIHPQIRRVAIANPDHAPYGRAAVAALQTSGVYDAAKSKVVLGENVAQAMQFAQSGAADAALVALSLALAPNARANGRWLEIPQADYPRLEQGGVIMRATPELEAARAFRGYLLGSDGRAVLQQYGFSVPER